MSQCGHSKIKEEIGQKPSLTELVYFSHSKMAADDVIFFKATSKVTSLNRGAHTLSVSRQNFKLTYLKKGSFSGISETDLYVCVLRTHVLALLLEEL